MESLSLSAPEEAAWELPHLDLSRNEILKHVELVSLFPRGAIALPPGGVMKLDVDGEIQDVEAGGLCSMRWPILKQYVEEHDFASGPWSEAVIISVTSGTLCWTVQRR